MTTMLKQKEWYTVQEVAEIFGVTDGRVRQWLRADSDDGISIVGQKFGRMWAVSREEVERLAQLERKRGNPNFRK